MRSYTGTAALSNWSGLFFTGGLRYDAGHPTTAGYVGSANVAPALASLATYQREHQIAAIPGSSDFSGSLSVALNADGTYSSGPLNIVGLSANAQSFVAADVDSAADPLGFSIDYGISTASLSGSGVYVNPASVLNAASLTPNRRPDRSGRVRHDFSVPVR